MIFLKISLDSINLLISLNSQFEFNIKAANHRISYKKPLFYQTDFSEYNILSICRLNYLASFYSITINS